MACRACGPGRAVAALYAVVAIALNSKDYAATAAFNQDAAATLNRSAAANASDPAASRNASSAGSIGMERTITYRRRRTGQRVRSIRARIRHHLPANRDAD